MTCVALIPSYRPSERLCEIVRELSKRDYACVVVDDGSGAEFAHVFATVLDRAHVVGYEENQGKGHALKAGLAFIQENYPPDSVVVTVDADGQHDVDDVDACVGAALMAPHALVLGCRGFDKAEVPLRSRIGNTLMCLSYRLVSGIDVRDTQTGLRAFRTRLIPLLRTISGERYEYEMNMLLTCPQEGIGIEQVPIRTIYEDNNASSHFRPVRDSLRVCGRMFAFAASSLASFVVDYVLFGVLAGLLATRGTTGVLVANVGARIASASCNFALNRSLVFHSSERLYSTAVRYALLAIGLLCANTLAVLTLVALGIPALVAKLMVESVLFVISWTMQNRVVFARRELSWAS